MRKLLLISILLTAGALNVSATTYYVSISSGVDSNAGTSKATAWAHLPGMATSSVSHTPVAGDVFVLMGCDVWTNASFPLTWSWSGTSGAGNSISVGVDKTWYNTTNCPSGWNRPVFDAGGTVMSGSNDFVRYSGGGSYTSWDNIEMRGMVQSGTTYANDTFMCLGACYTSVSNVSVTNSYFHKWNHSTQTSENIAVFLLGTVSTYTFDSNVIDNSDGDGNSGQSFYGGGGTFTHNIIKHVANGILPYGPSEIGYNVIAFIGPSFDATLHENGIECQGTCYQFNYIHDNVIHDINGESMFLGNNTVASPASTFYVWNNIIYNLTNANSLHIEARYGNWIGYYFNNTVVANFSGSCFLQSSPATATVTVTLANTHCLSPTSTLDALSGTVSVTRTTNLVQTAATANANSSPHFDQYSTSETFAYSPVAATNSTVGAGTDMSSSWPGGFSTNDTTYGCTEQTISGVVQSVCGARTSVARTSAWDIGAYQYSSGTPATPAPAPSMMLAKSLADWERPQAVTIASQGAAK